MKWTEININPETPVKYEDMDCNQLYSYGLSLYSKTATGILWAKRKNSWSWSPSAFSFAELVKIKFDLYRELKPIEMTVSEISKELGYDIKIVKEGK